jgi:hypothetical protein
MCTEVCAGSIACVTALLAFVRMPKHVTLRRRESMPYSSSRSVVLLWLSDLGYRLQLILQRPSILACPVSNESLLAPAAAVG